MNPEGKSIKPDDEDEDEDGSKDVDTEDLDFDKTEGDELKQVEEGEEPGSFRQTTARHLGS
jgi:hypothetical protein